jgi:ABC transporter DrrB family efflux protein
MTATATATPATSAVARRTDPSTGRSRTWIVTDSVTIAWRTMLAVVRNPQLLVVDTITPIMFVLLFAFVFGGAIKTPGIDYVTFLMPGIFVQTVVFGGTGTAIGLAEDLQKGIIDRFRSLPMAPSAVLIGRTFADLFRNAYTVVVMTVVGFIIGFRFTGGLPAFLLALALVTLFGYAISWLSANIGLRAKSAQAAQGAIFIPVFPLTFASSAFVPVQTMPDWLRPIAEANPVTIVVNAARGLILGTADAGTVLLAAGWIAAIVAVFAPLAIWTYRRQG